MRASGVLIASVLLLCGTCFSDSLFNASASKSGTLISRETTKFQEGDLITVLVRESVDARTQANTDTEKDSTLEATTPIGENAFLLDTIWPGGKPLPNWNIEIENEHEGSGVTRRANTLSTTIACVVTDVHENGNIEILGEKKVTVNREDSKIFIRGTVRTEDVTPNNTVLSTQVANAEISLKGQGPIWNSQRRGIFTRILDFFMPF